MDLGHLEGATSADLPGPTAELPQKEVRSLSEILLCGTWTCFNKEIGHMMAERHKECRCAWSAFLLLSAFLQCDHHKAHPQGC